MVTLRDGRSVLIRPILPSDAPALAESIESADADTIHRRFFGSHPQVTPELLDFLTTVDYTSRFALVAVEPASQRGVAIARYEPAEQDGTADVGIAVRADRDRIHHDPRTRASPNAVPTASASPSGGRRRRSGTTTAMPCRPARTTWARWSPAGCTS